MTTTPTRREPRYEIVCTRLTQAEVLRVLEFGQSRNLGITATVRMLMMTGLELIEGGQKDA